MDRNMLESDIINNNDVQLAQIQEMSTGEIKNELTMYGVRLE